MKKKYELLIWGVPYTLYFDDNALGLALERDGADSPEDIAGWTNHYYRECYVNPNVGFFQLVRTTLHEIFHAVAYVRGDVKRSSRSNEAAVDSDSLGFAAFFVDNVDFLMDLCTEIKRAKARGESPWQTACAEKTSEEEEKT